jgi:hypothetical protein
MHRTQMVQTNPTDNAQLTHPETVYEHVVHIVVHTNIM